MTMTGNSHMKEETVGELHDGGVTFRRRQYHGSGHVLPANHFKVLKNLTPMTFSIVLTYNKNDHFSMKKEIYNNIFQ